MREARVARFAIRRIVVRCRSAPRNPPIKIPDKGYSDCKKIVPKAMPNGIVARMMEVKKNLPCENRGASKKEARVDSKSIGNDAHVKREIKWHAWVESFPFLR